jgi:hypothetical protein
VCVLQVYYYYYFFSSQTKRMTTIEFGGGPSLEARRQFTNLKDGSQLPK